MENTNEINAKIAKNLAYYRKAAGLTQAELAEKINYSDKSVSKWESGNGIPDVYILLELSKLYGVTLNDLVGDDAPKAAMEAVTKKKATGIHLLIMLLSSGIVWLVATCLFVVLHLFFPGGDWWIAFLYAVMANAIVLIVFAGIWKYRLLGFISVSTLVWMTLTCIYVTARSIALHLNGSFEGLWYLFLLGIPLQVLEVLWVFFRSLFRKSREKKGRTHKKKTVEKTEEVAIQEK